MSTECIVAIVICIIIGGFCSYKAYSSGLKEGTREENYRLQRERDELKRLRKQIEQDQMETQVKCEALIKSTNQQYDRTVIDDPREFFALTVEEAVSKGFRRAYRWHGL